jgi:hypothetical protein
VVGKLELKRGSDSDLGCIISRTSWLDTAPERLCACLLADDGIGNGSAVVLVGLVLIAPSTPSRESPPTNSLPPRLCPRFPDAGVSGAVSPGVSGGVDASLRPVESAALKLNVGSAAD